MITAAKGRTPRPLQLIVASIAGALWLLALVGVIMPLLFLGVAFRAVGTWLLVGGYWLRDKIQTTADELEDELE